MAQAMKEPLDAVRVEGLSKTFGAQRALDDFSIEIRKGEIHALVGQNGSGKSTLIKILAGFHSPDPGSSCLLGGEPAELGGLTTEQSGSLRFIHQDLALVPSLTVRENLGLNDFGRGRLAPFDRHAERERTRRLLAAFDLDLDPDAVVGDLSRFEQSAVAIVRAIGDIDAEINLLVLDEPTASMGAAEVERLFATLRRINEMGVAILYVSHFLPEVLEIADRITVLRDGRRVAMIDAAGTTEDRLVNLIVGRSIERVSPPEDSAAEDALMSVRGLTGDGIQGVSFSVRRGEVLGLTGLVGSGFERVAECLGGIRPWDGELLLDGTSHKSLTPNAASQVGIVTVPAERARRGLIPHFTIAENVTLPRIGESWAHGKISRRTEREDVRRWLEKTDVQPPEPARLVEELSGGNQQKVMLAKALRLSPQVLVLAEPTQAVDVGASAAIRRLIVELAEEQRAIVVISSDPEELEQLCHRVLVTRAGRIACELVGTEITEDRILFESQFEGAAK